MIQSGICVLRNRVSSSEKPDHRIFDREKITVQNSIFVISDFMAKDYDNALRIAAKRHDIVGIHIADPAEEQLPNAGLFRALDVETGERIWLDTSDSRTRRRYADWYKENMQYFKSTFLKSGADSMSIRTTESYVNALLKFFQQRGK